MRPLLTTDPAAHGAAVRSYFVGAGLPADQIGAVVPYATVGASYGDDGPTAPTLLWYTSVIQRSVMDIKVVESIAYARFNSDGDAVEEGVYWPAIPGAVLRTALALKGRFADASSKSSYLKSLPGTPADGDVVIHHPPGSWTGKFSSIALVDVATGTAQGPNHFDENGRRARLDYEEGTDSSAPEGRLFDRRNAK
jgi:hypothetical protein